MADPPESPLARLGQRVEHLTGGLAPGEVGVADDAGDLRPRRSGTPLGRLGHELHLADRSQLDRAVPSVLGMAFDEHGPADVVAALGIGPQVVERIGLPGVAAVEPQVVMGVADRQVGFEDLLARHPPDPTGALRRRVVCYDERSIDQREAGR